MAIEMQVSRIALDPFTNMPIVILKDKVGDRVVPIWIGLLEASAIATQLENIELARPMTHDLLRNLLGELGAKVDRVTVVDLKDNTFFAEIVVSRDGRSFKIDSRPSDAIAIALRTGSPIFVEETVVEKSSRIDIAEQAGAESGEKDKWAEILANLPAEQFGKYKM